MRILRLAQRSEVIGCYLAREGRRQQSVAADAEIFDFDDCNAMDRWLKRRRLKHGVITGFRRWVLVTLAWEDLLECAVVERISRGSSERSLGALWSCGFLKDWEPITPNPHWHDLIVAGEPLPPSEALIMRPALPSEGARFYVEDGSGRAAYLVAHRPCTDVVAYGYIGFDPDPSSAWLGRALEGGHFVRWADRYHRFEDVLAS